jgi:hypothetical protein
MDSRYQRNICQIVHRCHQIVPQIIHKFQKKYKYTCGMGVYSTYVHSAGTVHGRTRTNHRRTCVYSGPGPLEHEHVAGTGSPTRATNRKEYRDRAISDLAATKSHVAGG